jgi:hypothetical protein
MMWITSLERSWLAGLRFTKRNRTAAALREERLRAKDVPFRTPRVMNVFTTGSGRNTNMQMETKFLRLRTPVELGSRFGEWQVCWLGG